MPVWVSVALTVTEWDEERASCDSVAVVEPDSDSDDWLMVSDADSVEVVVTLTEIEAVYVMDG